MSTESIIILSISADKGQLKNNNWKETQSKDRLWVQLKRVSD